MDPEFFASLHLNDPVIHPVHEGELGRFQPEGLIEACCYFDNLRDDSSLDPGE